MKVAVIGAGASGLTAVKALRETGLSPVVFESSADVGGIWVYRSQGDHDTAAYRSLRTNTSKQVTAFSDFPFSEAAPVYPSREVVEGYLRDYASKFHLVECIRFGTTVRQAAADDYGTWRLTLEAGGTVTEETYDFLVVCTGIFRTPSLPNIQGLHHFRGEIVHSLEYFEPDPFSGRSVLIVGIGSSAVDIATDLIGVAAATSISTRRGAWLVPRMVGGKPLDHWRNRLIAALPDIVAIKRRNLLLEREYVRLKADSPRMIWERACVPFDPGDAPTVAGDDLLLGIMRNDVRLLPGVDRVRGSGEMAFVDGHSANPDTVIFCTGYELDFPFLAPALQPWSCLSAGLYKLMVPIHLPTMAFIGVCRVHGPVFPIAEMQARWVASVIGGQVTLPSTRDMSAEVEARWKAQTGRGDSPIRVSLLPYLDDLARSIGAYPRMLKHLSLINALLLGPPVAAQYRLEGPGSWNGASCVIKAARQLR